MTAWIILLTIGAIILGAIIGVAWSQLTFRWLG